MPSSRHERAVPARVIRPRVIRIGAHKTAGLLHATPNRPLGFTSRPGTARPGTGGTVAALRGRLRRAGCLFGSAKRPMTAQQSSVIEAQDTVSGVFAQPKTAQKDAAE